MNKIKIDIQDNKLVSLGLESIIDFYDVLAIDKHKFANAEAFFTGINSLYFNVLFDFRLNRNNSGKLIEVATAFFGKYSSPWAWFVNPACPKNDLNQHGFKLLDEAPAMYFDLSNKIPNLKSNFISINSIPPGDDLVAWIQPIKDGYDISNDDDEYRKLNADISNKGEKKLKHYIAYYNDELAAAGTLFLSNDAVMLHNIATKEVFKKNGLATTLTLHMMEEAKNLGFKHCFLDSSQEALSLYKRIGFRVYCKTLVYSMNS